MNSMGAKINVNGTEVSFGDVCAWLKRETSYVDANGFVVVSWA